MSDSCWLMAVLRSAMTCDIRRIKDLTPNFETGVEGVECQAACHFDSMVRRVGEVGVGTFGGSAQAGSYFSGLRSQSDRGTSPKFVTRILTPRILTGATPVPADARPAP